MGADPTGAGDGAQGAVASALHLPVGGLPQNREVGGEQVGARARQTRETVEVRRDLLVVVPEPGDVDAGIDEFGGELQLHRRAPLHVHGPATPEVVLAVDLDVARGQVRVDRHGVDVPRDRHALRAPEVGARDDRVAVAIDVEVIQRRDRSEDRVGEGRLVARHAGNVADRSGQVDGGGGEVEHGHGASLSRGPASIAWRA